MSTSTTSAEGNPDKDTAVTMTDGTVVESHPFTKSKRRSVQSKGESDKVLIPIAIATTRIDKATNMQMIVPTTQIGSLDDEAHWEKKKKGCSFCKFMLEGPCAHHFKLWDLCVEKANLAGEAHEEKCVDFTGSLMVCMVSVICHILIIINLTSGEERTVLWKPTPNLEEGCWNRRALKLYYIYLLDFMIFNALYICILYATNLSCHSPVQILSGNSSIFGSWYRSHDLVSASFVVHQQHKEPQL